MTNAEITKERDIFLASSILLIVPGLLLEFYISYNRQFISGNELPIAFLLVKGFYIYAVFRFSRFLRDRWWVTLIYCASAPFSIIGIYPFSALLWGVTRARKTLVGTTLTSMESSVAAEEEQS